MKALVFADVTDPWAYIGATRFERAAATFSIVTGEPVEIGLRARLLDETARTPAEEEQSGAAARITGIDLNFADLVSATSFDAWRLLTWAAESGAAVQRDLAHQLWRAHFLEGADVADPLVLSTRAALVGLELETSDALLASDEYADVVRTQDETARSLGVAHLPYVVVESRWTLAGMQSQDDYVQALQQIHVEWSADGGP